MEIKYYIAYYIIKLQLDDADVYYYHYPIIRIYNYNYKPSSYSMYICNKWDVFLFAHMVLNANVYKIELHHNKNLIIKIKQIKLVSQNRNAI